MRKNKKPNFIFIMTDEQHTRSLSCYGSKVLKTPTADRLASEGVLFEKAFCANPLCMPSRGIFMTGRYSHTNGLRVNGQLLADREISLPEIFKSEGYTTSLCGKNHCFDRERTKQIFDYCSITAMHYGILDELPEDYSEEAHKAKDFYNNKLRDLAGSSLGNYVIPFSPSACDAGVITEAAVRFIEKQKEDPFFLWLSYPGPHWPFTCPKGYEDVVPPEKVDIPPQEESGKKPECQEIVRKLLAFDQATENDFRLAISRYYGNCRYIDDQIGRVLSTLEKLNLDEDTIILFTSDHGDYLGEHGLMHKSRAVYDCLMRIPFIWRWPKHIKENVCCGELVENVDMLPTVLDLCGIEIPPGVQGISHANALLGKGKFHVREATYGEIGLEGEPYTMEDLKTAVIPKSPFSTEKADWISGPSGFACGRVKMVRTKKWKLGYYPEGTHELYDLENDPWELSNLYGDPQYDAVVSELKTKLLDWTIQTEDSQQPPPGNRKDQKYEWCGHWEIK